MKKIISAISLAAIMLFCACGVNTSEIPSESMPAGRETAAAATASPAADTAGPAVTEEPFPDPLLLRVPSQGWEKYFDEQTIVFSSAKDMTELNALF